MEAVTATCRAFVVAGAAVDKASAAAEELPGYDIRLAGVKRRLAVLTWTVGSNLGLTLLALGGQFAVWSKLGELSGQIALLSSRIH